MSGDPPIKPVAPRPLLDAILVRSGFLIDRMAPWLAKRPARSPIRRRAYATLVARGFAAQERRDVETTLVAYEPDVRIELSGAAGLGLKGFYLGHAGWYEFIAELYESFTDPRYKVTRLVDAGERLIVEFEFTGRGITSGVVAVLRVGSVMHIGPRGRVDRQEIFWQDGWRRALEAAGVEDPA